MGDHVADVLFLVEGGNDDKAVVHARWDSGKGEENRGPVPESLSDERHMADLLEPRV